MRLRNKAAALEVRGWSISEIRSITCIQNKTCLIDRIIINMNEMKVYRCDMKIKKQEKPYFLSQYIYNFVGTTF